MVGSVVDSKTYQDLVHYFKYASSAYVPLCPRPNGKSLVLRFSNSATDIQGFVVRDSERKEIVVAIRGSLSLVDFLMDVAIVLVPFISPGASLPPGARVHSGFLIAWNSVVVQVTAIVAVQLKLHPGFSIATTGHSLGGALSSLAAVSLKHNFSDSEVRMYSYGAPRIGNKIYADHVNEWFGSNAYRTVHTNDGVPTMIPKSLGYYHHGIEYWQNPDPASEETTHQCSGDDGEDPCCSASVPSRGFTPDHLSYFGIPVTTPYCL